MSNWSYFWVGVLIVFLVIVCPLITIWALNILFPALAIPFTFWTWLAVLWLGGIFAARASK